MKKRVISILLSVLMIFSAVSIAASAGTGNLVAEADSASNYVPTNIINGSFDECPWMTYTGTYGQMNGVVVDSFATWKTYADKGLINQMNDDKHKDVQINGVDEGWNTSETSFYQGANFEWDDGYGNGVSHGTKWAYNDNLVSRGQFFIEMNLSNSAVLYQDLTTHSGDIIRWSLKHGLRSAIGAETQDMRVEIGAPDGAASGINDDIDSAIKADTKAVYESTGVSGVNAYANNDELAGLSLTKTANSDKWYDSKGVYVVPTNQNVTRFAFVSISNEIIGAGNLLDDISFSTLLGNLNAVEQSNGDVVISGYWGDDNADKKLCVKIGDETENIDMSAVTNKNFKITIPADKFESGTITEVVAYHQDYPTAKKSITIKTEADSTLTLGDFDTTTKTFSKAEGTGTAKFGCVAIYIANTVSANDTVTLPAGYTKSAKSDDYKIYVNLNEPATADEIAKVFISKVVFDYEAENSVRFELLPNEPSEAYFYSEDTQHYYTFVNASNCAWTDAYEAARNMQYNGRQGYLATVTSKEEDIFIFEASGNKIGWLGSSRLAPSGKDGNYYNSFSTTEFTNNWCWSCGPEIGTEFFDEVKVPDGRIREYDEQRLAEFARNANKGYYFNWDAGEPSNGSGTENAMTTLMSGAGYSTGSETANYSWNDVPYNLAGLPSGYHPKGYMVEFGDLTVGDSNTVVNPSDDGLVTIPEIDRILSVTELTTPVVASFATLEVLVSTPATKIQFVDENGNTATYYDGYNRVVSIVENADGTQTWTVNMMVYKLSQTYTVVPRFGKVWTPEGGYEYTISDKKPYDGTVYSVEIPDSDGSSVTVGRHDIIVETGLDATKVQFAYLGTTATFTANSASIEEKDGHLFWTCSFNFCTSAEGMVCDINTRTFISSFEYSGVSFTTDVIKAPVSGR